MRLPHCISYTSSSPFIASKSILHLFTMARAMIATCLVAVLALTFADSAQATLGKGKMFGKGKGISFQTQCQDVCRPICHMVPRAVCADVQVPYKDCDKFPVTTSVKRCGKVCQAVQAPIVAPVAVATSHAEVMAVPFGKGKGLGKGRHLMTIGKHKMYGKGKGMIAPVSIDCDTVCTDVPVTTFQTRCETKTRTVSSCRREFDQVCNQKCRPVCQKVPVMIEPVVVHQPMVHQPMMMSKGKGFGH